MDRNHFESVTKFQLSPYHLANLRWLLYLAYSGKMKEVEHFNTGDWCGELLWEIEQHMIDNDLQHVKPNSNEIEMPPFEGWHHGKKRNEVENPAFLFPPQ